MLNQERGLYCMQTYYTSRWSSVSISTINTWKTQYYNTLILLLITLDNYKSSDISAATLSQIHNEFNIYRAAGIKTIIRFHYNDVMIAKPWGDASSAAVVFRHIDQLTPVLRANEDVIAHVQAGLVGLWGEWYYTDSFGDQSSQTAQNKADRKTIITKLLAATPSRTVQVRTPTWMQAFYGSAALTAPNYATEFGRVAHHNDCFLADSIDMGTYTNYASQYPYLAQQTKFTPFIFETCAVSSSTRSQCPTALKEIAELHAVSGHRLYQQKVWDQWISGGCYETIVRNLGHRLSFVSSSSDVTAAVGSTFSVSVTIANTGYAAPSNARKTEVILRKVDDGQVCVATLNVDARSFYGQTSFSLSPIIRLPSNIPQGRWELLMQFADPFTTLYGVPWYKIQAANNVIYESGTGLHKLNAILDVIGGSASAVQNGEVRAVCGLSLTSIVNATVISADSSCLGGYYKVGSTCTLCPAGMYCSSATSSPATCAANTWSSGGQRTCSPCTSCGGKGVCQVKTGACLCNAGSSGFDCSRTSSTTPATSAPGTPATSAPNPATSAPNTPTTATPVIPKTSAPATSVDGCVIPVNILQNPALTVSGTQAASWTGVDSGYATGVGLNSQPSIQLFTAAGTVGAKRAVLQTVKFSTATTSPISFGAYLSNYLVSGVLDWDYMLYITVTYDDGTQVPYGVRIPTGSSGWKWYSGTFAPQKPVVAVMYSLMMNTHTGNTYLTQPVLALAPACAVADSPAKFNGGKVLSGDESSGFSATSSIMLGVYAAVGAILILIGVAVGVFFYRKKKQEQAVNYAVANQVAAV